MESWSDYINGLDFDLPEEGAEKPILESEKVPEETTEVEEEPSTQKVFVQKITTEVWVYTDTENKKLGSQTFQDLSILGEMDFSAFARIINRRKTQRKKKGQ